MKDKIYHPRSLELEEGFFSDRYYDSYEMMAMSTSNWKQLCPYQLLPDGLSGQQRVLQLHSMQISYAERKGGTMHIAGAPKNILNIGVIEACADKACYGRIKLKRGDILFFDDSHTHNFITNNTIKFIGVTICKKKLGEKLSKFSHALDHSIHDTDGHFVATLNHIWKRFTESSRKKNDRDRQSFQEAEEEILTVIMGLLEEQTPIAPKLTMGENIALDIRDKVFHHMDGNISIQSLAKEYKVSKQTLQNSFKSLFGFTPQYFLRVLKLNIVHQELQKSQAGQSTVTKIASKWGFKHMGRFSAYYRELFRESPSETLKSTQGSGDDIMVDCVTRQEEMT